MSDPNTVELATELTIAWLSNPGTRANADEVDAFLTSMNNTLGGLTSAPSGQSGDAEPQPDYTPAVSVRKSLGSREHIISMIDGKPYRTLRRHLATNGLTPDEYRARYNLKADYPMVAPGYSESRRETAKRLGLGRKPVEAAPVASEPAPTATEPAPTVIEPASTGEQPSKPERKARARKSTPDAEPATSEAATAALDTASASGEQPVPSTKPRARKSVSEAKAAAKKHLGG